LPTDTPPPTGTLRPTYTPTVLAQATEELEPTAEPTKAEATTEPADAPTRESTRTPRASRTSEPSPTPPEETPVPAETRAAGPPPKLSGALLFPVFDTTDQTYHITRLDLATGELEKFIEEGSQPAITPDGERVGWRSWKQNYRGLLSRPIDGTDTWQMIRFTEAGRPDWSPSGEQFVFPSRQEPDRVSRLYLFTGIGDEPFIEIQRHGSPVIGRVPAFLPDERIVYQGCVENECGLYIMSKDGANPRQLTAFKDDTTPAVSPDGTRIAYMGYAEPYWKIHTINADGTDDQLLTDDWYWNGLPTWSPDGRSIIFVSTRDENWPDTPDYTFDNKEAKFRLWVMDADGGNQRLLNDYEFRMDGVPAVAPDHEAGGWIEERMIWLP
jgi:Tol biopolymer transport system component